MKDRLLRILQVESMTSNKFAELMEVRPSNISHLLAGRNNPNFEFIGRMIQRIPNLNPDWLINGTGSMCRDTSKDLFGLDMTQSTISYIEDIKEELPPVIDIPSQLEVENPSIVNKELESVISPLDDEESFISEDKPKPRNIEFEDHLTYKPNVEAIISKVVVFYEDNTFEVYNQKK